MTKQIFTNFVILCGGSGSRLWPKSREKMPKQLLKLTNEYTMLQNTIFRILKTVEKSSGKVIANSIYIICNKEHSYIVENLVEEMQLSIKIRIVSEPKGRDSAPAICISSLLDVADFSTFVLPCDHVFDDDEFANCCLKSLEFLDTSVVTFGVQPTRIETGYGYIKVDQEKNTEKFIEKPNLEKATEYFQEGGYLWNAGIFAFKNKNMQLCFKEYAPDIYESCLQTISNTKMNEKIILLNPEYFENCRAISVDYAIMEFLCNHTDKPVQAKTIEYKSTWNDIGSFSSLYDELKKDDNQNVMKGRVITRNTRNCYIESEIDNHFIATIGVDNLIIVDTDDALLVCNKEQTQDVKAIVDQLKKSGRPEALYHKKVFRPWGWYKNIDGNDHSGSKVKRIGVYPGKRLSLQSHNMRSEHWVITRGKAQVQLDDETLYMCKNEHVYIPVDTLHRIENIGDELLEFTETQIGDYLGEDDIVRYEDDYGRI
jgi:mannose-1-phosphate guanylyltransferase